MKRIVVMLICVVLVFCMAACGAPAEKANTEAMPQQNQTSTQGTQANNPQNTGTATQPTTGNTTSEIRTTLKVDLTKRGEIKSNAPSKNSDEFVLEGTTMRLPMEGSALSAQGWTYSENSTAKDKLMDPGKTTNLVSFYLYDTDGNEMMLNQAVNNNSTAKPVLECQITSFTMDTFSLNEDFGDLVLPGGISLFSTAADVIAIFGEAENNADFDSVEVGEHYVKYVENKTSGLCYFFSFYSAEDYNGELDGNIREIRISTDY